MPAFRPLPLADIQSQFPQFVPAVACIEPFMHLFAPRSACVVDNGAFIRITSHKPLTFFHAGAKKWDAWINPTHVDVCSWKVTQHPGTFITHGIMERKTKKMDFFAFRIFLHAVDEEQQQAKSAITKTPARRSSKKKPSSRRRTKTM
jgi:hypothetical protein